jgi:asparagine N-glycosylation enzyme membrane subunit Stt3
LKGERDMTAKRKALWITALIIVAAVVIVLCVSFFTKGQATDYEGTLVRLNENLPRLI